jgi:hypothetical protein
MLRRHALLLAAPIGLLACSSDGGDATPDVADTGAADVVADVVVDTTPPPPPEVRFTLRNGNPGGISRWVQVETAQGTPGWWTILTDSVAAEELRPHDSCVVCACGETCEACTPEPEIRELRVGEEITGVWDLALFEASTEDGALCEAPQERDALRYRVQFCWSPEPPGPDGTLPAATLSCTRLPFEIVSDSEVRYDIEALSSCGDGRCDAGETTVSCPDDCDSLTSTDVVLACFPVCSALVACRDDVRRDECEAGFCGPLQPDLNRADEACLNAQIAVYDCAAELSCDDLGAFLYGRDNPCLGAQLDAQTACGDAG